MSQPAPPRNAFFAELTGAVVGAVSVLRIWGPDALDLADSVFRPMSGTSLRETTPGRPRVGHVGAGQGDEVVALVVDCGSRVDVEIQCHGGRQAVELVASALMSAGATLREASRWAGRCSIGPIEAEAAVDLTRAATLRTAEILRDQEQGALRNALTRILDEWGDPERTRRGLDELIDLGEIGTRLVRGWTVALAGRPNVGKSSLLNALAGFDRAIVADRPGTTRDAVAQAVAIDGWPVRLVDTAGLHESDDPIESAGVGMAREQQARADLVLVVLDRSVLLTPDDRSLLADHPSALRVVNKCDLPGAWNASESGGVGVETSANVGRGIDRLLSEISQRLVPTPPPPGAGLPFRRRHLARLRAIRSRCDDRARASLRRWILIGM